MTTIMPTPLWRRRVGSAVAVFVLVVGLFTIHSLADRGNAAQPPPPRYVPVLTPPDPGLLQTGPKDRVPSDSGESNGIGVCTQMTDVGSGVLFVEEAQFWIYVEGHEPSDFPPWTNRLVEPFGDGVTDSVGALVLTGINTGYVKVSVEVRDGPPTDVAEGWEDVAEASVVVLGSDDRLRVVSMMSQTPDVFPDLNAGAGDYRIRVHANQRGRNRDGVDREPVEEYLIVAWPAPVAPPVVHKMTSKGDSEPKE